MNIQVSVQPSGGAATPVAGTRLRRRRTLTWAEREEMEMLLDELAAMARREPSKRRHLAFLVRLME